MKKNLFTLVKQDSIYTNTFDCTHDRKFSANMGRLIPILCEEALPGDRFRCTSNHLLRYAPMLAPMMHQVNVYMHFWKVPVRILWNGYDEFFNSDGETFPEIPYFVLEQLGVDASSISDYLGFPLCPQQDTSIDRTNVNALFHLAYYKTWYEFYRDENLQDTYPDIPKTDGDYTTFINDQNLHKFPFFRAWEKDYFTSALPFAQKGNPVLLPSAGYANIEFVHDNTGATFLQRASSPANVSAGQLNADAPDQVTPAITDDNGNFLQVNNAAQLKANLRNAFQVTINDLRLAEKIQQFLEMRARGGTRYNEYLNSVWAVRSSDARLQRPEYLGGSKSRVNVSEVLQTSETTSSSPLAEMGGHGISVSNMNGFETYCEEHCIILGLMSVMPKPAYYQGLRKQFSRLHPFDYYQPPFAQLGEQAVLNQELYHRPCNTLGNVGTFGYQARWAEYRDIPSTVHGDFRTTNLFWHMAMTFDNMPTLSESFIQCQATERIFAVQSIPDVYLDHLWCHVVHELYINRKLPMFNVPSLV